MTPRADSRVPALGNLFPAARTPRRFLARLAQQLRGLSACGRGAAWLPELLAQRPRLCQTPLFGHSLAAAVQGGEERAETPSPRAAAATSPLPAAPQRQRRRSSATHAMLPEKFSAAARTEKMTALGRRTTALPASPNRGPAPLPGSARIRVERSLLTALAGSLSAAGSPSSQAVRLELPRLAGHGKRHLPMGGESGRLMQQLVQRLRSIHLAAGEGAGGLGGKVAAIPPAVPAAADLTGQWALPLAGQRVSRALLEAKLQPSTEGSAALAPPDSIHGGNRPAAQPRALGRQPAAVKGGEQSETGAQARAEDWRPARETAPLLASRRREAFATAGSEALDEVHSSGAPATASGFPRPPFPAGQTGKVFDPTVSLPAAEPTPGGQFFAALRRQRPSPGGAFDHRPTAVPGAGADDLEELTAKLQRILEEQARRHGIDV